MTIPLDRLSGLDLHQGDTMTILSVEESGFLVQISHSSLPGPGKAAEWLNSSKGAVHLGAGETEDDLRIAYYAEKYGLDLEQK